MSEKHMSGCISLSSGFQDDCCCVQDLKDEIERLIKQHAALLEIKRCAEKLRPFFTSGNNIPVERAVIKRELWEPLEAALEAVGKAGV